MKIYLLEAESFHVPGHTKSSHATIASMDVEAARLVNMLRDEVDLLQDASPADWQAKCLEARQARADEAGLALDDLNEGDVWFTEMDLAGFSERPAGDVEAFASDLLKDVIGDINTFRDMEPKEDESWQSWYEAAFDMVAQRIRETFERHRLPATAIGGAI
ncbi:hypothetical protein GR212_15670 [Rhizobium lusitanum]|uniref:Uncharacterized protein n=1 Tax=Rhizobium lusitanum TaxID=293958 RepID=A0A6L9UA86_9HYPH|nr:hypothetical protein [Rhizobium lusitanum]NEI71017.1 hypothetical protein [Rhizobium lusitanum]